MGLRGDMFQGVSISLQISGKSRARSARGPILWGAPSGGTRSGGPIFQSLEKCSTFQHGDPSKTEPFDRRGADFPILGRFRLAEPQSAKFFRWLEIWPRRGGIAERCNAKGRNRRKAKPNAKHTAPPAREPYPAKTHSGNFRRRVVAYSP